MVAASKETMEHLRVVVLCGGVGSEREVSLESGEAVTQALRSAGFAVAKQELKGEAGEIDRLDAQVAFLALHGEYGEDGQVQELLEKKGIPYTGSDPKASALAMDKNQAKHAFAGAGLNVAKWIVAGDTETLEQRLLAGGLSLPVVVKPNSRGSSVGVSIVREAGQLKDAVAKALEVDRLAMIEEYLAGRELTVSVVDGKALPVLELVAANEFYDYQAKYQSNDTRYLCPAPLEDAVSALCRKQAEIAFHALGMRDVARIDFILCGEKPYILEANSIPGCTSHSLLPKAAQTDGISFPELCGKLVGLAWSRRKA